MWFTYNSGHISFLFETSFRDWGQTSDWKVRKIWGLISKFRWISQVCRIRTRNHNTLFASSFYRKIYVYFALEKYSIFWISHHLGAVIINKHKHVINCKDFESFVYQMFSAWLSMSRIYFYNPPVYCTIQSYKTYNAYICWAYI